MELSLKLLYNYKIQWLNSSMTVLDELKAKKNITRDDIEELLASYGKSGENQTEKLDAMKSLNKKNSQGAGVELTITSYRNY